MSFNYGHDNERRIDLSDPWYKNAGLVSGVMFFVILAIGMLLIALI